MFYGPRQLCRGFCRRDKVKSALYPLQGPWLIGKLDTYAPRLIHNAFAQQAGSGGEAASVQGDQAVGLQSYRLMEGQNVNGAVQPGQ